MNESVPAERGWQASAPNVPWIAWLLVFAAAIQIIVLWLRESAAIQPVPLGSVVGILADASPFLLAAAVLVSVSRWSGGRRWLVAGAALFAFRGLLDLGLDVWSVSWQTGNAPIDATSLTLMAARGVIAATLSMAAPLLLAAGLWTERSADRLHGGRLAAMAVLALVGVAATAGGFVVTGTALTSSAFRDSMSQPAALIVANSVITALHAAAFAALGVAALRVARAGAWLPELLIASGTAAWVGASGWLQWREAQWMAQGTSQGMPADWFSTVTLSNTFVLVGLVAMIAGFAVAGLRHRPLSD